MIAILLAAYNGEAYIAEQIESILAQTYGDWRLIVSDDCSSDSTCEIVERFAVRDARVSLVRREEPSGGAKQNFAGMFKLAEGFEHVMFCDHDDVWLPDKIEKTYKKMQALEARYGNETPLLAHTDLRVVDKNLNEIEPSLIRMLDLSAKRDKLNQVLSQNVVTGCAMMANAALMKKSPIIPGEALMHDWWLALVASAFGHIGFIDEPTVLYRQHGGNEVGAKPARSLVYILKQVRWRNRSARHRIMVTYMQAGAFMREYSGSLDSKQLELVRTYTEMPAYGRPKQMRMTFKYGFWKKGILRKLMQIVLIWEKLAQPHKNMYYEHK